VSEELSQGFVSFTLSQVDDVPENTIISNTADIFFDFNLAITTNTVENLIKNEVTSFSGLVSNLVMYPNPTSGLIHVESTNPVSNFELTDMSGRRVWSMDNEVNSFTTDLSHIAPGMYMIQWLESGQLMHSRIQIH
ncbi:MAG: T9SS type A sorting domain-containing protein, partial [Bacteroidota bacterium]|nr:T9SS type A sorting domain-containing protein [Bacteroidota bacterium]